MDKDEVIELAGEGFQKKLDSGGWRIARNGYRKGVNDRSGVRTMGRHRETKEVFILLTGAGFLLTGGSEEAISDIQCRRLEKEKLYVVFEGTWHFLVLEEDSLVLIVENVDTGAENSDVAELSKEQGEMVRMMMEKGL